MSKSLTIAALFASLTLGGCLGGTGGSDFVDLSAYQRGKHHFNVGHFGLAVSHFESAVRREPSSVEALNGLAASYDKLGRFDLSARYYERALAADPDSTQTLNNIGYSYLLQERFDLAVAYLRDAQSRDKEDRVVLANRMTAEVAYQDADLKRSVEEARAGNQATAPVLTPSRPQVAARPSVSSTSLPTSRRVKPWIERTAPKVQTLVTRPQVVVLGAIEHVKPWIERTAPKVQTLVTRPQVVVLGAIELGAIEEVGIDPQLAAYRPQQPSVMELLPDHATAPISLDAQVSSGRGEALRQEDSPAPDQPQTVPVTGLVPAEVAIASLDPLSAFDGVSAEAAGDADHGLVTGRTAIADPAPIAAIVANLDASRDLSGVAPVLVHPESVATTELVAPEVMLSELDPLDAFEDDVLETVDRMAQEEAGELAPAPVMAPVKAEFEVAALGAVIPDLLRIDAPPAIAVVGGLPLLEVSNGTGRLDMAARVRDYLAAKGVVVKRLTNAEDFRHQETVIFYRSGWRAYAEELARMLPAVIDLDGHPGQESDVRLELGGDLLEFDRGLYYAVKRPNDAHRG